MINGSAQKTYKNLRDVLVDKGLIDIKVSEEISLKQVKTGESEEEIIRSMRLVTEEQLTEAKSEFIRVPYVDLDSIGFAPEALSMVPESVAEKYKVVPYGLDTKEKVLMVTMVNPLDLETIEFLEKKTGYICM